MSNENIALFENEFSQIELNHRMNLNKKLSPTKRKKLLYPQALYPPQNSANSIPYPQPQKNSRVGSVPILKTPTTPNRLISTNANSNPRGPRSRDVSFSNNTYNSPTRERVISCPMSDSSTLKQDYQFSFMKETTSSLQKKQTLTPVNINSRILSKSPSTVSSSTKKRLDYARQLSQRTKRHSSNSNSTSPSISQYDSQSDSDKNNSNTNRWKNDSLETSPPGKYREYEKDDNMMIDDSPSKPRRHVTEPLPNVFDRLYPSTTTVSKLSAPKSPKEQKLPKIKYQIKIDSIQELYQAIYARCPNMFTESKSNNHEIQLPYDIHNLPLQNLNEYERGEIIRTKEVYYLPDKNLRTINISKHGTNFEFDDENGNYIIIPQDHINYRYEIISNLGTGSFGNVVMARDHKTSSLVAVKIINNRVNGSFEQSMNEIKMLKTLQDKSEPGQTNFIMMLNHFNFRSHMCIISEILSINLYSLLEATNFQGLGYNMVQNISRQLLLGLQAIHDSNIIHCDIKPENVMLRIPSSPESTEFIIKIIDFGSSCLTNETSFQYIQSRYYRAPEVLLGAKYDQKIDIWSLGCLLVEVFTGFPLLPGKNEYEQIGYIMELFGPPKPATILRMRQKLSRKNNQVQLNLNLNLNDSININSTTTNPLILSKMYKKTLLYKIFDHGGKLNLYNLQQYCNDSSTTSVKKQFKVSSKSLDIQMGLNKIQLTLSQKQHMFQFLQKMFVLEPLERSNARNLLAMPFVA